jgi:predicted nucleic acid-binding protein
VPAATRAGSVHAVLDTNVVVSGFLKAGGTPARLLALVPAGILIPVYSDAIVAEYEEVLARPRLAIDPEAAAAFLDALRDEGVRVAPRQEEIRLPDPDDYPFIAAARVAACPVVTGNLRHYPRGTGVEALSPARFLAKFDFSPMPGAQ